MIRAGSGPGRVDTLLSGVRGISGDLDKDFEPDADEEDILRNKSGWRCDGNPCPIGAKAAAAAAERSGGNDWRRGQGELVTFGSQSLGHGGEKTCLVA